MMLLSDEFHDLMRQQTSYSALVAWWQRQHGGSYAEACQHINHLLRLYRQVYAPSSSPRP